MELHKTRLQNKMEDGSLRGCLVLNVVTEIAMKVMTDSIIDDFNMVKNSTVEFR